MNKHSIRARFAGRQLVMWALVAGIALLASPAVTQAGFIPKGTDHFTLTGAKFFGKSFNNGTATVTRNYGVGSKPGLTKWLTNVKVKFSSLLSKDGRFRVWPTKAPGTASYQIHFNTNTSGWLTISVKIKYVVQQWYKKHGKWGWYNVYQYPQQLTLNTVSRVNWKVQGGILVYQNQFLLRNGKNQVNCSPKSI